MNIEQFQSPEYTTYQCPQDATWEELANFYNQTILKIFGPTDLAVISFAPYKHLLRKRKSICYSLPNLHSIKDMNGESVCVNFLNGQDTELLSKITHCQEFELGLLAITKSEPNNIDHIKKQLKIFDISGKFSKETRFDTDVVILDNDGTLLIWNHGVL